MISDQLILNNPWLLVYEDTLPLSDFISQYLAKNITALSQMW